MEETSDKRNVGLKKLRVTTSVSSREKKSVERGGLA
jgi:hypothetical protein